MFTDLIRCHTFPAKIEAKAFKAYFDVNNAINLLLCQFAHGLNAKAGSNPASQCARAWLTDLIGSSVSIRRYFHIIKSSLARCSKQSDSYDGFACSERNWNGTLFRFPINGTDHWSEHKFG